MNITSFVVIFETFSQIYERVN